MLKITLYDMVYVLNFLKVCFKISFNISYCVMLNFLKIFLVFSNMHKWKRLLFGLRVLFMIFVCYWICVVICVVKCIWNVFILYYILCYNLCYKIQVYFCELATVHNFSRCKTQNRYKKLANPFKLYLLQKYKLYRAVFTFLKALI